MQKYILLLLTVLVVLIVFIVYYGYNKMNKLEMEMKSMKYDVAAAQIALSAQPINPQNMFSEKKEYADADAESEEAYSSDSDNDSLLDDIEEEEGEEEEEEEKEEGEPVEVSPKKTLHIDVTKYDEAISDADDEDLAQVDLEKKLVEELEKKRKENVKTILVGKAKPPSMPAKNFDADHVETSEYDSMEYIVVKGKSGVKRWKRNT